MDEYDRKQARSIIDNYLGRLQDDHEEKSKQLAEMEDALIQQAHSATPTPQPSSQETSEESLAASQATIKFQREIIQAREAAFWRERKQNSSTSPSSLPWDRLGYFCTGFLIALTIIAIFYRLQ